MAVYAELVDRLPEVLVAVVLAVDFLLLDLLLQALQVQMG